jgi:2-isopropylmalate synthase
MKGGEAGFAGDRRSPEGEVSGDGIVVFDTTLRDGEQAPGASMDMDQKIRVARALQRLHVDVIEAGFPAASPGDFAAVAAVAREIEGPTVCALARAEKRDIDQVEAALRGARRRRCHVFLATSPLHREHKLHLSRDEVARRAEQGVAYARQFFDDVEYSAEDAARTEPDFLAEVVERAVAAGATTINIPDTVGYALPTQFGALIAHLRKTVRGIERVTLSVHCHNDLGLAVANTLAALEAGARQIECTVNGIGERAGNCSLEEVVMAVRTRSDHFGLDTSVRTQELVAASRIVSEATGFVVQRNKAVVGENAFAHEAGIHQHGMLQHAQTYEIMRPEDVGFPSTRLVLGKHSGRHVLRKRLEDLGHEIDAQKLDRAFAEFKTLADRRKEVHDVDLEAIMRRLTRVEVHP